MSCARFARMLGLHAGGDLPAKEAETVKEHLADCEVCRTRLEGLRRSMAALKRATVTEEMLPAEDPAYWQEVETKLRGRQLEVERLSDAGSWWVHVPRVLAQAAVVLAAAGVVVWFAMFVQQPIATEEAPTLPAERSPMPLVVFVRPSSPHQQDARAEVTVLPASADVVYSDFNHVVRPGEIRRLQRQFMSPPFEDDNDPSRF